MFDWLPCV